MIVNDNRKSVECGSLLILLVMSATVLFLRVGTGHAEFGYGEDANFIRIYNAHLELVFSKTNGGIESFIDRASSIDLRSSKVGAWSSFWGVGLYTSSNQHVWCNPGGFSNYGHADFGDGTELRLQWTKVVCTTRSTETSKTYQDLPLMTTVRIRVYKNDPMTDWSISMTNPTAHAIEDILFPGFSGIGKLGSTGDDDRLLVPDQEGRLFLNPASSTATVYDGNCYPSGFMNMQFLAYYDESAGFYFTTQDTEGYTKRFSWDKQSGNAWAFLAINNYPTLQAGSGYDLPYKVKIGVFHGDWQTAAQLYRDWAARQWWTSQKSTQKSPEWLFSLTTGRDYSLKEGGHYSEFLTRLGEHQEYFKGPTLTFLWGWEHGGAWAYGDYFPPQEGWTDFESMVERVHSLNSRLWLFVSGPLLSTTAPIWMNGEAEPYAVKNETGQFIYTNPPGGFTSVHMCPHTQYWKRQIIQHTTTLAQHRVDLIQLDQFPWMPPPEDFDVSHGHAGGFGGNWWAQSWLDVLAAAKVSCKAAYPDVAFSGEGGAELFLPYLDVYHSRDNWAELSNPSGSLVSGQAVVVPLFEFVYHEYVVFVGEHNLALWTSLRAREYNIVGLGRTLTWGQTYTINMGPHSLSNTNADNVSLNYASLVSKVRAFAGPWLSSAKMLPSPALSAPRLYVTSGSEKGNSGGYSGWQQSIQMSSWQSEPGDACIVLTNVSPTAEAFSVPIDFRLLSLRVDEHYQVWAFDGATYDFSTEISNSSSLNMTIPSYSARLLMIMPEASLASKLLDLAEDAIRKAEQEERSQGLDMARSKLAEGHDAYNSGRYDDAVSLAKQALQHAATATARAEWPPTNWPYLVLLVVLLAISIPAVARRLRRAS